MIDLFTGLGTGLALIVAIGVQNTYLLRLAVGSRLRVVAAAVVVCALSDAVLILAGVLGVGVVVERFPVALIVIRLVGAAFLVTYGVLAARRALRPSGEALRFDDDATAPETEADATAPEAEAAATTTSETEAATTSQGAAAHAAVAGPPVRTAAVPATRTGVTMRAAVLTMLVFTWANPHVYLDTLVFLGSVANQQGDGRGAWSVGAVLASCLWFSALGFGGRLLRPLFARPVTWRVFDALVAVVMLGFGAKLLLGL